MKLIDEFTIRVYAQDLVSAEALDMIDRTHALAREAVVDRILASGLVDQAVVVEIDD